MNSPFVPGDILLPQGVDMTAWACVACDQYTSEPGYWAAADRAVGTGPSALRLVLPEIYLSAPDADTREEALLEKMEEYLSEGLFTTYENTFFYIERTLSDGRLRHGLVGALDLEAYDYAPGCKPPVRATEGTVVSRIPPRLRVRSRAALELPHILLLCDDEKDTVFCAARADLSTRVYDFPLMQGAGSLRAWCVGERGTAGVLSALEALGKREVFEKKYGVTDQPVLHIAVGDGNHSLATAKAHYERLKNEMGEKALTHPARYALCELCNLHEDSLVFEPIHRVIFHTEPEHLLRAMEKDCGARPGVSDGQNFSVAVQGKTTAYTIPHPAEPLCVGTVQKFLDAYMAENPCEIDYIHGSEVVRNLTRQDHTLGILLPAMKKQELFPAVIRGGVLPRKTFSMGNAPDKRFYVEARKIR